MSRVVNRIGYPTQVSATASGLTVSFASIDSAEFQDAFDFRTIDRNVSSESWSEKFDWTEIHTLSELSSNIIPAGMIFHHARCGSTLMVRLLRCFKIQVYAEPLSPNYLLMPPMKIDKHHIVPAIRFLVHLIGLHSGAPFIIKHTSWNAIFAGEFVRAFPHTPWVFVARDPVATAMSVLETPPFWLRSSGRFTPYAREFGPIETVEQFVAAMLAAFVTIVTDLPKKNGQLVLYDELPGAVVDRVSDHFGLNKSAPDYKSLEAASNAYSKNEVGESTEYVTPDKVETTNIPQALSDALQNTAMPAMRRLLNELRRESGRRRDFERC